MPNPSGLTGAPRRLLSLASVLNDEGIRVCIATQSSSELIQTADANNHETDPIDAVGVLALRQRALFGSDPLFRLRVFIDLLRQNWQLLRCIRRKNGDVVWIRGSKGIAFGALGTFLSRRPLIWDVDYELPSRGIVRWLHQFGIWASKVIVFQYSEAPKEIFGREVASRFRKKIRVIIPGVEISILESYREKRKQREKPKNDPFVILQVGTICDRKNQKVLIEALINIKKAEPSRKVEIWFAGRVFEKEHAEALQDLIDENGLSKLVSFLGWREDVHDLMVRADLLVMPSRDEGVPNTVQEAMAIGLPVAVSQAGGMPEVVADRDTGWVLEVDNASAWAKRIIWCLNHPTECEAVGHRGCAYALEHFGTEQWGKEYGHVVKDAVGKGDGR